jgi:hypothetical protein
MTNMMTAAPSMLDVARETSATIVITGLSASALTIGVWEPEGAAPPRRREAGRRRVPFAIPRDQLYYWSREWTEDVEASLAELEAGEFVDFDSNDPNDVARWLLHSHH